MACTPAELTQEMNQFIGGTEKRYRHWANQKFIISEGLMAVAEKAGAHWFLDILALEVVPLYAKAWLDGTAGIAEVNLQVLTSSAQEEKAPGAYIEVFFDERTAVFSRHIEFTDFPEGEWSFLLGTDQVGEDSYITSAFLTQEY